MAAEVVSPGVVEVAAPGDAEPLGVVALLLPLQQGHGPHAVHHKNPAISESNRGAGDAPRLQYGVPDFLWADKTSAALYNPVEGEVGWAGGRAVGKDIPVLVVEKEDMHVEGKGEGAVVLDGTAVEEAEGVISGSDRSQDMVELAAADIAAAGNREDTAGTADRDSTGDNRGTGDNGGSARRISA